MQEFETGVSLEIYLFLLQQRMKSREAHSIPGLCDACLPDIIQVLEHELYRVHWQFTRNEDHCEMVR